MCGVLGSSPRTFQRYATWQMPGRSTSATLIGAGLRLCEGLPLRQSFLPRLRSGPALMGEACGDIDVYTLWGIFVTVMVRTSQNIQRSVKLHSVRFVGRAWRKPRRER